MTTKKTIFPRKKIAMFTDIHFGKKSNSVLHNQDCLDFVKWFCAQVTARGDITHVAFLGDWFENRNAVNVMTMHFAHEALKLLNSLNIPVYIIIGNHDLYHRENRKVFSTKVFDEFSNVKMVSELFLMEDILIAPFLFKHEYKELATYMNVPYWLGHFEFRNFVITGSDRRMEHGPDHTQFNKVKYIFSGHFHKRQANDNVIYIGNAFPMDYGDAWDDARGMAVLDTSNDDVDFVDWEDCPKYRKVKLTDVLSDNPIVFPPKCRVRCIIDTEISYSDAQAIREEFTKNLGLREFSLEENLLERKEAIAGEEVLGDFDLSSLNDAVIKMLEAGISGTSTINPKQLIDIYERL